MLTLYAARQENDRRSTKLLFSIKELKHAIDVDGAGGFAGVFNGFMRHGIRTALQQFAGRRSAKSPAAIRK
jgi:hypothetical protein